MARIPSPNGTSQGSTLQGPSECGFLKTTMSPDVGNPILALLSPVEQSYGSTRWSPRGRSPRPAAKSRIWPCSSSKLEIQFRRSLLGVKLSPSVKSLGETRRSLRKQSFWPATAAQDVKSLALRPRILNGPHSSRK